MNTLALIKVFLTAYFVEHDVEKGLALVTEDVKGYGFVDNQEISGLADLRKMAATDEYSRFMNAELTIEKEDQISEDNAILVYSLSLNHTTIRGRIAGSSRKTREGNKLYFINNSPLNPLQTLHVYEDVARMKRAELAKELLGSYISGGMMGGYMEPGFPFYFINDNMLRYLGYESEAEFVRHTQGLIENCIYADDRKPVDKAVAEQLSADEKYEINYRMLKKDGSFIWVHDVGKKIVAEDGRDAILSACYDITAEKEHERFLNGLVAGVNGDLAMFAVDVENKCLIPTYVSEYMGKLAGITSEEFLKNNADNAMSAVFESDREHVWKAVCDAVLQDASPSISLRIYDKNRKIKWVNASFAKHGEKDGLPVILVLFTASTIQNDLQLHTLSQNGIGITVIDANTHELYFVNDAMFHMMEKEPCDYTGRLCSEVLMGCGASCEDCKMKDIQKQAELDQIVEINGKWLAFHGERREWAEKMVVSIYATDVTKQRALEQQVADEDAQLQGILKNMACGICVSEYDKAGTVSIVYTSDVFLKLCGADRETVIDTFAKEPFHGVVQEDVPIIQETTQRLLKTGGSDDITYRFMTFGGNEIWVHAFYSVLKKPDGGCTMYFTSVDVTENYQLHKQLEDLVENIPGAVCLYRWDGEKMHRLMVGQGFDDIFGASARKLLEQSQDLIFKIVHSDDRPGFQNFTSDFIMNEENQTASYQYRVWNEEQQTYLWISTHAKKLKQSDGSILIYVVYTNDTEQIMLKNRLADTRTAINAAVQYGRLGLWTYDLDSRCILQNLGGEGSYGYDSELQLSPEILISKKVIHEEDAKSYLHCYQKIHDGATNSDCVVRVFDDSSKEYRFMHLYLIRQPDGQHTSHKAIGMSFDIHQEVTSYEALSKVQAQLKQEKQVIDELFENLPGGVVMHRWDGQTLQPLYVSKGFSDLYGEDGKAMLERTKGLDYDVVHPDDLPGLQKFILSHIEKTGQLMTYRYRVWNKQQKEYIWIQLTGNVKRQPDGTSIAYANYANVDAEVKAAREIRREEELLEKACQLAHIWMFHYSPQTKQIHLSKGLQEDYQIPADIENFPDDFLKYPVIPQEYHALYRQMIQKVDAGEDATTEMQSQLPDGTRRFIRFEWHITRQENGKTIEVTGLPIDITREVAERKRTEKERQKLIGGDKQLAAYTITDLRAERIVEAKNYHLDVDFQPIDTCDKFTGNVAPLLLTEEDRQHFLKMRDPKYAIAQYEAGITEWTADMRWKDANGQIRWQRSVYSVLENIDTGTLYQYCYLYDIMEEKISQALFSGIQDNLYLKTGVLSLATGHVYEYEGDYADRQLKITEYEVIREQYTQAHVLPEDVEMVMQQNTLENVKKQLRSNQKAFSFTHRGMKDGMLRHYQVLFAMVPTRDDLCISVVRDITDLVTESDRRNAELQKALAAANAATQAKSEFLSRMSHEIRTPMNAIMGMTAIAQDNKSDFLQVSDCLNKIDSSSQYLLTLINDILEMSRIEGGKIQLSEDKFDFAALMEQIRIVAEPIAKKSEIRLELINRTENGSYYGDRIRIQQVMINLLGNALKFTKKNGRVRFAVSIIEDTETATTFKFVVEDTGIGMSEKFMQKMFEAFVQEDSSTTSQYGGSGLGLAISKSLVEAMGGTITAESMVGVGTNFTVHIPLKKMKETLLLKEEKTQEIPQAEQDAILKGKRILMAEDHPMNIMIAKKLLERKGILITVAENGKIAVETFRNSAPNEYDAILMDIRMPVMDGLEATRQIRALDRPDAKEIPIIAMTANALEEDRRNSKAAGMDEHLAKPIDPKRMYQMLAQQIARRNV